MKKQIAFIIALLMMILILPLSATEEISERGFDEWMDVPQKTGHAISQYLYLVDAKHASEMSPLGVDSVEYARRSYIAAAIEKPFNEAVDDLVRPRRVTSKGNELYVAYSGYDSVSDCFMFNLTIDMEVVTKDISLTIPGKYLVDGTGDAYISKINRIDQLFMQDMSPIFFDITYIIKPVEKCLFSVTFDSIEVWSSASGKFVIGAYDIDGGTLSINSYPDDMINIVNGIVPSGLYMAMDADDPVFYARNSYGMTNSLEEIAGVISSDVYKAIDEENRVRYEMEYEDMLEKARLKKGMSHSTDSEEKADSVEKVVNSEKVVWKEKSEYGDYPDLLVEANAYMHPELTFPDTVDCGAGVAYIMKGLEFYLSTLYGVSTNVLDIMGGIGVYVPLENFSIEGNIGVSYAFVTDEYGSDVVYRTGGDILPALRFSVKYNIGSFHIGLTSLMEGSEDRFGITFGMRY